MLDVLTDNPVLLGVVVRHQKEKYRDEVHEKKIGQKHLGQPPVHLPVGEVNQLILHDFQLIESVEELDEHENLQKVEAGIGRSNPKNVGSEAEEVNQEPKLGELSETEQRDADFEGEPNQVENRKDKSGALADLGLKGYDES